MSRTHGHTKSIKDTEFRRKKMKPYVGDQKHNYKFQPEGGRGIGVTKMEKLICKNANRSLKKGKRQEKFLEDDDY